MIADSDMVVPTPMPTGSVAELDRLEEWLRSGEYTALTGITVGPSDSRKRAFEILWNVMREFVED